MPTTTTGLMQPTTTATNSNVANWFRNALGRDPEQGGLNYWNDRLQNSTDPSAIYSEFLNSARANNEAVRDVSYQDANSYSGTASPNLTTSIDEWGRNVLGRELTPEEMQRYSYSGTQEGAQAAYNRFLSDNAGQIRTNMDRATASQISTQNVAHSPTASNGTTTATGTATTPGSSSMPGSGTVLPTAAQVTPGGLMSAPAIAAPNISASPITATGYTAAQAASAPDVVASPVSSRGYSVTQAAQAADVVAQNAAAGTAVGAGYDPNLSQVNVPTDTVQGQIEQIIAKNSPLMQRAQAQAIDQMNARGLQNSSMAVGAGQAALYDVALPIATTDANTYNATRFNNQSASNTAAQFGADAKNQASIVNAQLYTDVAKSNADRMLQAGIINQQQANEIAKFNAQNANTAAQFEAQSANEMAQFNADQLLKAGIINQQQANEMAQFNAQGTNAASQFNAAAQNATAQFNSDQQVRTDVVNQQQANDMARFNTDTSARLAIANLQNSSDVAKFNASQSNDLIKLGMDATTRTSLANIEASYKVLMQSSASASDLYKQAITSLAGILSNKDIADKAGAMNDIMSGLNDGLGILGDIANLNLGSTLNFSSGAATPEADTNPAIPGLMSNQAGGVER